MHEASESNDSEPEMTDEERLDDVLSDATELWNNVICEVSHYSSTGKSSTGSALDIDFVIQNMDDYFTKLKEDKSFVDGLGEEYENLISAFDNMCDKADSIQEHLKEETPSPNTELSYKEDIELFEQYFRYFYDVVTEMN